MTDGRTADCDESRDEVITAGSDSLADIRKNVHVDDEPWMPRTQFAQSLSGIHERK